jgi:hypothetical protein
MLLYDIPIECINRAAVKYHIPATVIVSILKIEGGKVGQVSVNKNGTLDYGPMQINSSWLKRIKQYGYDAEKIKNNPCANVNVGTWILAQEIGNSVGWWKGVGHYHSHDAMLSYGYSQKVKAVYQLLLKINVSI